MGITGGFGTTLGLERWADSGHQLTQELLNSMMREPGEATRTAAPALPSCPQCGERYCGDGTQLCAECATSNAPSSAAPQASAGMNC